MRQGAVFKEVGWNGIHFTVPPDWNPGRIGVRDLLLEDEAGPRMEVKWWPRPGLFSGGRRLSRVAAGIRRQAGKEFREEPLAGPWKRALQGFEAIGYRWSGAAVAEKGVFLRCPECSSVTLIRFLPESAKAEDRIPKILESFRDCSRDDRILWAVFDMRALAPRGFALKNHRFEAGRFELALFSGRETLFFFRWGPADAILRGRSLLQFAETAGGIPQGNGVSERFLHHDSVCWEAPLPKALELFFRRIVRSPCLSRVRMWHLQEKNRIMALRWQGPKPPEPGLMEELCRTYEAL